MGEQTRKIDGIGLNEVLDWIDAEGKPNIDKLAIIAGAVTPAEVSKLARDFNSQAVYAIREVIRKQYKASQASSSNISDPNWPVQIAWQEGYRKALEDIYKTIPIRSLDRLT